MDTIRELRKKIRPGGIAPPATGLHNPYVICYYPLAGTYIKDGGSLVYLRNPHKNTVCNSESGSYPFLTFGQALGTLAAMPNFGIRGGYMPPQIRLYLDAEYQDLSAT